MLDLFTSSIYSSHSRALSGGEDVAFQNRKMSKTTNALYLTDNQDIPIAISSSVSGNHHDLYQLDTHFEELFQTLRKANISTDGLFINADAGFEPKEF